MIQSGRRGGAALASLALILALSRVADGGQAGAWTNVAGHALEATPTALEDGKVTFLRPSGEELKMPLHSFLPEEQRRIKESLGILEVPGPLRSAYRLVRTQLETAQALYADGRIDEHEFSMRRREVLESFLKTCESLSYARDSVEVRKLLEFDPLDSKPE